MRKIIARSLTGYRARESFIITGLLILALSILFGLYDQHSRGAELLTKVAFAILVTVVTRLLALAFTALDGRTHCGRFKELGMVGLIKNLDDEDLQERLAKSHYIKVLKTWFPENETIEKGLQLAVERAIKDGKPAEITLLLANPDSKVLAQRSDSAAKPLDYGADKVIRCLYNLTKWVGDAKNIKVRVDLYDAWPGCPVLWYGEDEVLMGFYFWGQESPRWPWIEVGAESRLRGILEDQFKKILSHNGTEPLEGVAKIQKWLADRAAGGSATSS